MTAAGCPANSAECGQTEQKPPSPNMSMPAVLRRNSAEFRRKVPNSGHSSEFCQQPLSWFVTASILSTQIQIEIALARIMRFILDKQSRRAGTTCQKLASSALDHDDLTTIRLRSACLLPSAVVCLQSFPLEDGSPVAPGLFGEKVDRSLTRHARSTSSAAVLGKKDSEKAQ
ncbi:hypothetical protein FA15DRAFT_741054 [Coprinopsis marcescibilis]|uniref:Uncharacterized protein n=1 Tax=Coprinopsis marcescibilis TaxID=230819 RepID=A0A5C3KXE8_COPMA|nr:hypothetical protein FA15DRAFT_741054 [Coprinopsis marcescibilis]